MVFRGEASSCLLIGNTTQRPRQDAHPLEGGRPAGLGRLAARLAGYVRMIEVTAQMAYWWPLNLSKIARNTRYQRSTST
jgi:hypothetical protein